MISNSSSPLDEDAESVLSVIARIWDEQKMSEELSASNEMSHNSRINWEKGIDLRPTACETQAV